MKFYGRTQEINELLRLDNLSNQSSQFTILLGRRRTGKTTLMTHAFESKPYLYFFIDKKTELIQCASFQKQVENVIGLHIHGQITNIASLIEEIMIYSRNNQVTLIIDEFQRLADIDESIISDLQCVWDKYHNEAHIHLIACGSIYSMMQHIFEDRKEPLFGRKTARIDLKPFGINVLKQILYDHNPNYNNDDLLMLYAITGGVAKYVAQLMDEGSYTLHDMLHSVCKSSSIFINEGTELLIGEFGRKHQIYYSILQLIANGATSQSQIDSIIGKNTGRYLETLEKEYSLILKHRPMWAKPNSQGIKYHIEDNFLMFWFRFVEANRTVVELGKFNILEEIIRNEYPQYSGLILERYFRQLYGEMERVTEVSHWWDSKGNNEIDLIALMRLDKIAVIAEVKRNPQKYNPELLKQKYQVVKGHLKGYKVEFRGLSMTDM